MTDELPDVVSIDPPGAKELDDALSCVATSTGWTVDVCVPDVPALLTVDSEEDLEAREAGLSLYGPTGVRRSMLRPDLVRSLSLSPDEDRPMVHIRIDVACDLNARVERVTRLVHRTAARLTYGEGDKALAKTDHPHHARMSAVWDLASRLHDERAAGTGAVFDVERRFYVNEEGQRIDLDERTAFRSNMAVMEFMVLANAALARHAAENGLPILYRNHRLAGFERGDRASAAADLARRDRIGRHVAHRRLRTLSHLVEQADMGTVPLGHHGLDVTAYAWFTSPLRRYADVVNLRALLDGTRDQDLEALATRLTGHHRAQKGLSDEHHGRTHRRRIVRSIAQGDLKTLEDHDIHTIVRALSENPGFDAAAALRHLGARMVRDDLSGRDMEALLNHAEGLFGSQVAQQVREWASEGARAAVLAQYRGDAAPSVTATTGVNHKGVLSERAASLGGKVEYSAATRTGPPHAPIFTVKASWRGKGEALETEATGRTKRDAEQNAAELMMQRLDEDERSRIVGRTAHAPQIASGLAPKTAIIEMGSRTPGSRVTFDPASQEGPPHQPRFRVRLHGRIGPRHFDVHGEDPSKRDAEKDASLKAIDAVSR